MVATAKPLRDDRGVSDDEESVATRREDPQPFFNRCDRLADDMGRESEASKNRGNFANAWDMAAGIAGVTFAALSGLVSD